VESRIASLNANGEKAQAIANYKKSLELNPKNTGAVDNLKLEGK